MKRKYTALIAVLLSAVLSLSLFGCSQTKPETETSAPVEEKEETSAPAQENKSDDHQATAQKFATLWESKWKELSDSGIISNGNGNGFLADMDADGQDELIFLYDSWRSECGFVFSLGKEPKIIDEFRVAVTEPVLTFTPYKTKNGILLQNIAVHTHVVDSSTETEETYIKLEDGHLSSQVLYYSSYGDVDTYYDMDSNEISADVFAALRDEILSEAEPLEPIYFEEGDFVDCSDTKAVEEYVKKLLDKSSL